MSLKSEQFHRFWWVHLQKWRWQHFFVRNLTRTHFVIAFQTHFQQRLVTFPNWESSVSLFLSLNHWSIAVIIFLWNSPRYTYCRQVRYDGFTTTPGSNCATTILYWWLKISVQGAQKMPQKMSVSSGFTTAWLKDSTNLILTHASGCLTNSRAV